MKKSTFTTIFKSLFIAVLFLLTQNVEAATQIHTALAAVAFAVPKRRGTLTIDGISPHKYKSAIHEAQLRQEVVSEYPTVQPNTGKGDSLVPTSAFGLPTKDYTNTRIAWVAIPVGYTTEQVQQLLDNRPNAGIKQITSHALILSSEQESALSAGITTRDQIAFGLNGAGGQLIRAGKSGDLPEGTPILVNGLPQYRVNVFVQDVVASPDVDLRPDTADAPYALNAMQQAKVEAAKPVNTRAALPNTAAPVQQQQTVAAGDGDGMPF